MQEIIFKKYIYRRQVLLHFAKDYKPSIPSIKLVSAYKSLVMYPPYLVTYKNEKNFKIHNTRNAINGGVFSPMKKLLKIHNGFTKNAYLDPIFFIKSRTYT